MEIEYSLDESDLMALAYYQVETSPAVRRRFKTRRFAYLFGFSLMAAGSWLISNTVMVSLGFAALGVLIFILYPQYSKWITHRKIPGIVHSRMVASSIGPRRLNATSAGLELVSESGESKARWKVVDNVIENPQHTFISIERNLAIIIPRLKIEKGSYEEFMNAFRLFQKNSPA